MKKTKCFLISKTFPLKLFVLSLIFILFSSQNKCDAQHNLNDSIRLQVKKLLEKYLPIKYDKKQMDPLESLQHLFNGLAVFNDHYRFGGILDYCKEFKDNLFESDQQVQFSEKRNFEENMDREMMLNVNAYVECVNGIYTNYSNVVDTNYGPLGKLDIDIFKNFMRAFLLTKPIFLAVESIRFMTTENHHLFGKGWVINERILEKKTKEVKITRNVRRNFFLLMASTQSTDVQ